MKILFTMTVIFVYRKRNRVFELLINSEKAVTIPVFAEM